MRITAALVLALLLFGATAMRAPAAGRTLLLGRSYDGRPIVAFRGGDPRAPRVLVFGCIHGIECAGTAVARALLRVHAGADLWVVPNLNPDGFARGRRQNGRGVDLNANWSSEWRGGGRPWDVYYPGPRPFSERETRIARDLILRLRPRATIWFHQHLDLVWAWGPSSAAGRTYARAAGLRFFHHRWLRGTATNWQNHHLRGSAAFTVELPAGDLSPPQVRAHVRAVLAVARAAPRRLARASWTGSANALLRGLPVSASIAAGGRLLYERAARVGRAPASNEKLLLSLALLDRLGPSFRIPTIVRGALGRGGTVAGDLGLVGGGDPELDDAALARLARRVRAAGVRRIRGAVVGVTSTFTRERWAPGWRPIALRFVALPTALAYDGNAGPRGFVFDPERRAAAALTADLRTLGVRVDGVPRASRRPPRGAVLARIRSAPLVDLLRRQNRESLNFHAEVLTKLLGATVAGPPGSTAKGARAIAAWARGQGVAAVVHDGSGLSYADRISTDDMVRLLRLATVEPWGAAFASTLPGAGEGTLAGRLLGLRVQAKTGTLLDRVSALSGRVWLDRSRRWAEFSILSRGLPKRRAVALEDELVALAARAG